jgi:hypothetical protein
VAGLVGKSRDPLFVMPAEAGISGGGRGRVRQVLRLVLLPPAAPAFGFPAKYYFAGAPAPGRRVGVKDGRRTADARFPWLEASVTGAVPPPHRLRGRLRWGLGLR